LARCLLHAGHTYGQHGYFNFGLANSYMKSMIRGAGVVIIEVNNTIPLCLGGYGENVHISKVDYIIEVPIPCYGYPAITCAYARRN